MKASALLAGCMLISTSVLADVTCGEYESHRQEGGVQGKLDNGIPFIVTHNHNMVSSKAGSKFDGLSGHCGGLVTLFQEGVHATGACALQDKEGDVAIYHFVLKRGEKRGTFMRDGGTGKFAKSFETGWFQQTSQDDSGAKGIWGGKSASVCQ